MSFSKGCGIICEKQLRQDVKICPKCFKNTVFDTKQSASYEWSRHIICKSCGYDWYECKHHATTQYMVTNKQLKKHDVTFHKTTTNEEIVTVSRKRKHIISPIKFVSVQNQK